MAPEPPKKLKFAPKAPPRRAPKPEVKTEKTEEAAAERERAMKLMQQFQERSLRGKSKVEKKETSQVAFGSAGSSGLRSFSMPKPRGADSNAGTATANVPQKEYVEPWDYYSYYPVTLPIRRPYSGDPATLDEQEFGQSGGDTAYDETVPTPAEELELLEENVEPTMFFFQLPATLPLPKKPEGKEAKANAAATQGCKLEELPAGFMGKMQVYKSGKVKLKLGDMVYDVCGGMEGTFAQDVVAINMAEKHCCVVGEVDKRAVLIPDIESITTNIADIL